MIGSDWFLLGAPWDCSGTGRGEQLAPAALRRAGLSDLVDVDLGDAATTITSTDRDPATGIRALPETVAAAHALAEALHTARRDHPDRRPLILGGDCSLLLGVFLDLGDTGLWIVDGHPDFVDPPDSDTGETADSELAILTGRSSLSALSPADVVLIGHRTADLDPASAAELSRLPADLLALDARAVIDSPAATAALAAAHTGARPMWLHVDVDVLDPAALPAVTYPQPGGPGFDQLAALLTPLAAAPALCGVSVADFRPDLDPDGRRAEQLVELLSRVL
ncbi:arginase family protein [Actinoplanes solisilvae]|uniref:arginase family protein n=1 Tax=Actinoplanes solisilvae TaxID=2486853 RepID=UPI001F0BCA96|nr:arginase family protein [Actinoplanes solisilvae]